MTSSPDLTTLYRMFDGNGRLLYVGVSKHALARLGEHARDKGWFSDIDRVTCEHFDTRCAALTAEAAAIRSEGPLHNIVHARPRATAPHPLPEFDPNLARDTCEACDTEISARSRQHAGRPMLLEADLRRSLGVRPWRAVRSGAFVTAWYVHDGHCWSEWQCSWAAEEVGDPGPNDWVSEQWWAR